MKNILLIPDVSFDAKVEEKAFSKKCNFYLPEIKDLDKIDVKILKKVNAVLIGHSPRFNKKNLEKLESCKIIVRLGIGYDNVDIISAGKLQIPVCIVPDYGVNEVADHTFSLLLNLSRHISGYDNIMKNNGMFLPKMWNYKFFLDQKRLSASSIGIIGLGRIGTAVARRAKSFGMNVFFYDPYKEDGYDKSLEINRVHTLTEIAKKCNIITLHASLNKSTKHMLDEKFFSQLTYKIIFVNTARGGLVSEKILIKYFRKKKIIGIGIDTLENEPPNINDPIIKEWIKNKENNRIILTPHCAFYSNLALYEMRFKAAQTANNFLFKNKLNNCVNLKYLKKKNKS